jgi:hypothetical protein
MPDVTAPKPSPAPNPPPAPVARKEAARKEEDSPRRVFLISIPNVVFMYPSVIAAVVIAVTLHWSGAPLDPEDRLAGVACTVFLGILAVNFVIMAFDFPRATSLTLFLFIAVVVLAGTVVGMHYPEVVPDVSKAMTRFRPMANPAFYWAYALILGGIMAASLLRIPFDYWEVRPNELLHHHGVLSDLERYPTIGLRIDKEINDIFEFVLLGAGRLILYPSNERRAIVLENVLWISGKEKQITRMLSTLQVEVRNERA